jgi:hypothetical protein
MPANPQISHARYHPQARLLIWHPHGVFDDRVADRAVEFVESNEQTAGVPFHRYADFCGLTPEWGLRFVITRLFPRQAPATAAASSHKSFVK